MFEISGTDITNLNDADLRSLVARLALAELRRKGYPRSSVTAGGHQNAPDGGLDVRVECPTEIKEPDFVPRSITGFQVKKPDMPPSAIRDEMKPKGILRDVIHELVVASGAYIIVSSQGSLADKPLAERRKAMRAILEGVPNAEQIYTDFYDRERLATWANEYPGIAAWVRSKVGRALSGWSQIGEWECGGTKALKPYLSDDKACLIDEHSSERDRLAIREGISRLRAALRVPKRCIRLVGLSGTGKTRLVQALFEEGVGDDPLDSSCALYTDYSEETDPTARDMARDLIAQQQQAILVVDNCNPSTHAELARLCSADASTISVITIEYDVRDDVPEHTKVFRLQSASPELVSQWIERSFPDISQADRSKIAEFSDGNFRVACALAETLKKGETLGSLKSRDIFERMFHQRNLSERSLLKAAEDLSLLYSIDGEDTSDESELYRVAQIRGIQARELYEALAEMRQRDVVQARGRYRAILPQAIANRLASYALDRIPPAQFDQFCSTLTPRMLRSVSRRLGYLHDSSIAQALVVRWLRSDGPFGNLFEQRESSFQIIANIAPAAPERVLQRFEELLLGPNEQVNLATTSHHRYGWMRLIKSIGYDAHLFHRVVDLLVWFVPADPTKHQNNAACDAFCELFHLSLSGTQAAPKQRREAIRRLAASDTEHLRFCAKLALRAILKSGHYTSNSSPEFGARSRDWGWRPAINGDIWDWFKEAIRLAIEILPEPEARKELAAQLRTLWCYPPCRDAIEDAASGFVQKRPWIEGWIACRATLRYDGKKMDEAARANLEQLTRRLKPSDLLNQARAVVLTRMPGGEGWDFADGVDDEGTVTDAYQIADGMAQEVGRALANDEEVRGAFLNELFCEKQAQRAYQCGQGLAEGAQDLDVMWHELMSAYGAAGIETRNATVLGGFICAAYRRDEVVTSNILEDVIQKDFLLPVLPYLQARASLDVDGLARLRRAIAGGKMVAPYFSQIANGSVSDSPPEALAGLLVDIAAMAEGAGIALDILHMHFFSRNVKRAEDADAGLASLGRSLLNEADFDKESPLRDYAARSLIEICLTGKEGCEVAKKLCQKIQTLVDGYEVSLHELAETLEALFTVQPFAALDSFLLHTTKHRRSRFFDPNDCLRDKSPIEHLDVSVIEGWADLDPDTRYPILGRSINFFIKTLGDEETGLSPLFLALLEKAPNKAFFLGSFLRQLHPSSWCGSLADILNRRKAYLVQLTEHPDEQVRSQFVGILPELDRWINRERERDRSEEESFE